MKTPNPLAAALLLLAASASAQPFAPGAGTSYSFTGQNPSPVMGQAAPVTDFTFRCGTPPWKLCTDVEMNQRQAILMTRTCPSPVSTACADFLMKNLIYVDPIEVMAAYTPPPGREWASPTCQRIPCALAEDPAAPAPAPAPAPTPAGRSYEDAPGFIGPPSPFRTNTAPAPNPPPMTEAKFQETLAEVRRKQPDAIDLGNQRYGIPSDDGSIMVYSQQGSSKHDQSEFADKIQQARAEKAAYGGGSGGGKSYPPPGGTPPKNDVASASDEARGSGNDAGDFFKSGGGGGGAGSDSSFRGASAGGSDGSSGGYAAKGRGGKDEVIAAQGAELDGVYTYIKTQEIKASIEKTAGAVAGGVDGTFATPTNTPDANAGDLQFLGTQSGANE